jgi:phospholipid-translocating ATPase
MHFPKRPIEPVTDEENDESIDPDLRLRTVRTAASAIAESIRSEAHAERRKMQRKRSRFFRVKSDRKRPVTAESAAESTGPAHISGARRNVYVNYPLSAMEVDQNGEPEARYVRNKVRTSSEYDLCLGGSHIHEPFRIYHHHIYSQESIRAVSTVRLASKRPNIFAHSS